MKFILLRRLSISKWSLVTKVVVCFALLGSGLTVFRKFERSNSVFKRSFQSTLSKKILLPQQPFGLKITRPMKWCVGRSMYGYEELGTWNEEGYYCEIEEIYEIGESNPHLREERLKNIRETIEKTRGTISEINKNIDETWELLEKLKKAVNKKNDKITSCVKNC